MANGFTFDAQGYYITKDPDATLDYTLDWSTWLGADTIASVAWTLPSGITLETQSNTTTTATAWISGGSAGVTYRVTCRITTAGSRIDDRSFRLNVAER